MTRPAAVVLIVAVAGLLIGAAICERIYQAADRWAKGADVNARAVYATYALRESERDAESIAAVRNGMKSWVIEREGK